MSAKPILRCWAIIWGDADEKPVTADNVGLDGNIFTTKAKAIADVRRFRTEYGETAKAWVVEIDSVMEEAP